MTTPLHGPIRYAVITLGVLLATLVAVRALPSLMSPRGAVGPTLLQAQSPLSAVIFTASYALLAAVIGGAVGRVTNAVVGMFVFAIGMTLMSFATAGVRELAMTEGASVQLLAVEMIVLLGIMLAATVIVFLISGPLTDIEEDERGRLAPPLALISWKQAACVALMVPIVWIVAISPLRAQAMMAVLAGGAVFGLAGRLLLLRAQPQLMFIAPCIAAAILYLVTGFLLETPLDVGYLEARLAPVLNVMPLDYAAGGAAGTALGIGWARSFIQEEDEAASVHT